MKTVTQYKLKFGLPNQGGTGYLTQIELPFQMRIAWDKNVIVNRISCHRAIAPALRAVFAEILLVYGLKKIQELGIDLFGGCFNYRKMRGG